MGVELPSCMATFKFGGENSGHTNNSKPLVRNWGIYFRFFRKADGIVKYDDIEFCLLDTSGPFGISDNGSFVSDHVKGLFGALTFLRNILKTYYYATEDTLLELKVIFVHAKGKIST